MYLLITKYLKCPITHRTHKRQIVGEPWILFHTETSWRYKQQQPQQQEKSTTTTTAAAAVPKHNISIMQHYMNYNFPLAIDLELRQQQEQHLPRIQEANYLMKAIPCILRL